MYSFGTTSFPLYNLLHRNRRIIGFNPRCHHTLSPSPSHSSSDSTHHFTASTAFHATTSILTPCGLLRLENETINFRPESCRWRILYTGGHSWRTSHHDNACTTITTQLNFDLDRMKYPCLSLNETSQQIYRTSIQEPTGEMLGKIKWPQFSPFKWAY